MPLKHKIFLVDDDVAVLRVVKNVLAEDYEVFAMTNAEKLFEMLDKIIPDLILLDVYMPVVGGYQIINTLKADERAADVPVIFLTSLTDDVSKLKGLSLGATEFITKPVSPQLLLNRVSAHLAVETQKQELSTANTHLQNEVYEKNSELAELQIALLYIITDMLEFRDVITGQHTTRVSQLLKPTIAELLQRGIYHHELSGWDADVVVSASLLHDVGKISISDAILLKPGKLTDEEFDQIKKHPGLGGEIISKVQEKIRANSFLKYAKLIAVSHHEKWDGSGYPAGLKGTDIPLVGRITAIADVYDALVSDRPYKKAFSRSEAVKILRESSGSHFDPDIVESFIAATECL